MAFNIDMKKLGKRVLPHFLRKPNVILFLNSCLDVLQGLNDEMVVFAEAIDTKVRQTSQVIYLEKLLNDRFDPTLKRIFIQNTSEVNFLYIRNNVEGQPQTVFLSNNSEGAGPVYYENNSEIAALDDYIINVPASASIDEDELRSQVNVYNLAGKKYDVITF